MTDILLKIAEVAKILGISVDTVRRMVARGDLPVVVLGPKTHRYRQSDVDGIIGVGREGGRRHDPLGLSGLQSRVTRILPAGSHEF